MLRNAYTSNPTVDFSQVTHIELLGENEEKLDLTSIKKDAVYIKKNDFNYTIYLHQINEQDDHETVISINVPDEVIPAFIKHKFSQQRVILNADANVVSFQEFQTNLEEDFKKNRMQSTDYTALRDTNTSKRCETTANYAVTGLIGAVLGAAVGELVEPGVNYFLGYEYDQESDMPFYVMTGGAGAALALLIRYCGCFHNLCQRMSFSCNMPTSIGGMFGRNSSTSSNSHSGSRELDGLLRAEQGSGQGHQPLTTNRPR